MQPTENSTDSRVPLSLYFATAYFNHEGMVHNIVIMAWLSFKSVSQPWSSGPFALCVSDVPVLQHT